MRILILGAGGRHRTEAALVRAARSLGHEPRLLDALQLRRVAGRFAGRILAWRAGRFEPDFVLCTRHACSAGERALAHILRLCPSAFWYFDALTPLPPQVATLGRLVRRVFATYGFQVDAFLAAGAAEAHFLPQGTDPDTDRPATRIAKQYRCDLSFIGSGQFVRRHGILQAFAAAGRLQVRGPHWESAPAEVPVVGGPVRGGAFAEAVGGAAISLGIDALEVQRQESSGGTSNRLWRVLGAGGFYLGEGTGHSGRFAANGVHAAWYRTLEEGVALARHYLADPEARARIAAAGRAHALAEHCYTHRLARLLGGQGYTST